MTPKFYSSFLVAGSMLALTASVTAQDVQIPLNYNFNGIVHAGEDQLPDDPNGYRSMSDRGLNFTGGIPSDPLLAGYTIVDQAFQPDIVHLGNRNTVSNGTWAFQATANGDCVGTQPAWLPNVDQTGPQTTTLSTPLAITQYSSLAVIFNVSDGGGSMDVTVTMQSGATAVGTVSAGDWFGGGMPGSDQTDCGNVGGQPAGLHLTEQTVDLSAHAGDQAVSISFGNASNGNAGYAIVAATLQDNSPPRRVNNIALNYNFNGIVHAGENGQPDDLNGYRSISDRGLDFTNGVPADATLDKYNLISQAGVPDMVHLGNRNTVSGGNWAFQATANGDCTGVQPSWLADPDQTGLQTTVLADPILMDAESYASGIFHISDGGGTFDVILTFQSGFSVTATIGGGDWFGGPYPGTDSTDCGNGPAAGLHINEQTFDLSATAGQILTSISFGNRSNGGAGYAIFAMNVAGCLSCPNGGSVTNLGGGNGPTMSTSSNGNMGCDLDWTVSGATPGSPVSVIALGIGSTSTPLGALFASCTGTIAIQNPVANLVAPNAQGQASVTLVIPPDTSFCGLPLTGQYAELAAAACPVLLSDALTITLGN